MTRRRLLNLDQRGVAFALASALFLGASPVFGKQAILLGMVPLAVVAFRTAGAFLLIANLNLFLIPSQIAPGGVSGTAIILHEFTGWPVGLTMLALNVPLLALGFRYLGRFRFLIPVSYTHLTLPTN